MTSKKQANKQGAKTIGICKFCKVISSATNQRKNSLAKKHTTSAVFLDHKLWTQKKMKSMIKKSTLFGNLQMNPRTHFKSSGDSRLHFTNEKAKLTEAKWFTQNNRMR